MASTPDFLSGSPGSSPGWDANFIPLPLSRGSEAESFRRFVAKTGKRPRVFSFDLTSYGSLQFPEPEVHALAGFSDKTMETLRFLGSDKSALIREIERIEF